MLPCNIQVKEHLSLVELWCQMGVMSSQTFWVETTLEMTPLHWGKMETPQLASLRMETTQLTSLKFEVERRMEKIRHLRLRTIRLKATTPNRPVEAMEE